MSTMFEAFIQHTVEPRSFFPFYSLAAPANISSSEKGEFKCSGILDVLKFSERDDPKTVAPRFLTPVLSGLLYNPEKYEWYFFKFAPKFSSPLSALSFALVSSLLIFETRSQKAFGSLFSILINCCLIFWVHVLSSFLNRVL